MHDVIGMILVSIFIGSCLALLITFSYYSKLTKFAIIAIAGTVMIAHGSRIITQAILYPGIPYIPNFFDIIFDWLTLIVLGVFVTYFGFVEFYSLEQQKYTKNKK
jgi:hypothetical protein